MTLEIPTARLHAQPLPWLCHACHATGTLVPHSCQPAGHLVPHCQDSDPVTFPPEVFPGPCLGQSVCQHSPEINLQGFIIGRKKKIHVLMEPEKFPAPQSELTDYIPREPVFRVWYKSKMNTDVPGLKVITQKELSPPQGGGSLFVLCRPSVGLMVSTSRMGSVPHRERKLIDFTGSYTHRIQNHPE